MGYKEDYRDLCHGTDAESAHEIQQNGFEIRGDQTSWCGRGTYFYDVKAKAWWAAKRKCREIQKKQGRKVNPTVLFADIRHILKEDIFDLRIKKDMDSFQEFTESYLAGTGRIKIDEITDETERIIHLRAFLISFFADKNNKKLVIGDFKQRPQPLYEKTIEFADSLQLVVGIETIYCAKDTSIISNIHEGDNR